MSNSVLIYEGSVKNLWKLDERNIEFEFTNAYSVFDWGRMPDLLANKGESLATMGAYFFTKMSNPETWKKFSNNFRGPEFLREKIKNEFEELSKTGLCHHFQKQSSANRLRVDAVQINPPQRIQSGSQTLFQYAPVQNGMLIPLEVVFRFGIPQGSSLVSRLTPEYAKQLGFNGRMPQAGEKLEFPIIEFFSKLEPTDRFLTWEQALNYSGLQWNVFEKMIVRTICVAHYIADVFESSGVLELWDGKLEWALSHTQNAELMLVDAIGPDELRLQDKKLKVQFSKEFLRQFYRKTEWYNEVEKAKKTMSQNWKDLVINKCGEPPRLSPEYKEVANLLYPSLTYAITQNNPAGLGIPLHELQERIAKCLNS